MVLEVVDQHKPVGKRQHHMSGRLNTGHAAEFCISADVIQRLVTDDKPAQVADSQVWDQSVEVHGSVLERMASQ